MIVFFDMMFLNDVSMLPWKQHQRMETLESIILQIPGRAALAEQYLLDFSKPTAASELRDIFAKCIVRREEGLVMKPADDAYFSSAKATAYQSCSIKLKKEYIGVYTSICVYACVSNRHP
jgi:DNA ligase-4